MLRSCSLPVLFLLLGCGPKPGTHVEVTDSGGKKTYVGGAAGPGINQGTACEAAVQRAVAAIAVKFASDYDDVGDDIAEELGADNGEAFLQGYAKSECLSAAVMDKDFDPIDHLCMATVHWSPPLFVKDGVRAYAEQRKAAELANKPAAVPSAPASAPQAAPASVAAPAPSAPAATQAAPAPVAQEPVAKPAPSCAQEDRAAYAAKKAVLKADEDLAECLRRTSGDVAICHRYTLYAEEARSKNESAEKLLAACRARP